MPDYTTEAQAALFRKLLAAASFVYGNEGQCSMALTAKLDPEDIALIRLLRGEDTLELFDGNSYTAQVSKTRDFIRRTAQRDFGLA